MMERITGCMPRDRKPFRQRAARLTVTAALLVSALNAVPAHADGKLIGYCASWKSPNLYEAAKNYDIVCFAFGASGGVDGAAITMPYTRESPAQIKADIRALQSEGKKVLLSVGGAGVTVRMGTPGAMDSLIKSVIRLKSEYGFDGIDVDIENGCLNLDAGDDDINHPTTPSTVYLIKALYKLRSEYGPDFMITMAPQTPDFDAIGHWGTSDGIGWGAYLPLINKTRDIITYVMTQNYDSGTEYGGDGKIYTQSTADFDVAMGELLLRGFTVDNPAHQAFAPLKQSQVVIGVVATPPAAGTMGGYLAPKDVSRAVKYLRDGTPYGGSYRLLGGPYPDLGGVMVWNCNFDHDASYPMVSMLGPIVHAGNP